MHIINSDVELVLGPKLGFWGGAVEVMALGQTVKGRANGAVVGVNAGIFVPVGDSLSMGALASFTLRTISQTCTTEPGFSEVCNTNPDDDADKVVSVTGGMLF